MYGVGFPELDHLLLGFQDPVTHLVREKVGAAELQLLPLLAGLLLQLLIVLLHQDLCQRPVPDGDDQRVWESGTELVQHWCYLNHTKFGEVPVGDAKLLLEDLGKKEFYPRRSALEAVPVVELAPVRHEELTYHQLVLVV